MRRRTILALLVLLVGAFAFAAVGCGGDDDDEASGDTSAGRHAAGGGAPDLAEVTALPSASCTDIEYEGEGEPDVLIASDLPLQGSSRTQTLQIVGAIKQVLTSRDWKAGDLNVGYQSCDDSTAQAGKWDPANPGRRRRSCRLRSCLRNPRRRRRRHSPPLQRRTRRPAARVTPKSPFFSPLLLFARFLFGAAPGEHRSKVPDYERRFNALATPSRYDEPQWSAPKWRLEDALDSKSSGALPRAGSDPAFGIRGHLLTLVWSSIRMGTSKQTTSSRRS